MSNFRILTAATVMSLLLMPISAHTNSQSNQEVIAAFLKHRTEAQRQFIEARQRYINNFEQAKKELAKTWDVPELSDNHRWVQYSNDDQVKRTVDFSTGEITVEVLTEEETPEVKQQAIESIVALEEETTAEAVKQDKVISTVVMPELESETKVFPTINFTPVIEKLTSSIKVQEKGTKVVTYRAKLPDNYLDDRSSQYIDEILEYSAKVNLDPALVIAIIHIESHFNPVAQSHIPAFGLMQIVPATAGRDVTKLYLGKEKLLTPESLFQPKFNINVGTGYLHILTDRYLAKVQNEQVREYLAIAAYNGGVGSVAKHFSGKKSLRSLPPAVANLTPEQVYDSIVNDFPYQETRNYLKKVHAKRLYYQDKL